MKKIILSTLIIFTSLSIVFAEGNSTNEIQKTTTSVSGQVIDKNTNEILAGVAVIANGQKVYTDFDGKFTISNLCEDNCTITITQISYESQKVELDNVRSNELNIMLSKR